MIWLLRKIGIHLWITAISAVPICFYALPKLETIFPGINPVVTGLVVIFSIVMITGISMDIAARKTMTDMIKKGESWERSGIPNKALKKYTGAIRIFDTFLLWPFSVGKMVRRLVGAIARFQLNTGGQHPHFKPAIAKYLIMNPEDIDMARLWLEQLELSTPLTALEQDVLTLLAETHNKDVSLSVFLSEVFLRLGRKDFIARKLYQQNGEKPFVNAEDEVDPQEEPSERVKTLGQEVGIESAEVYPYPEKKRHTGGIVKRSFQGVIFSLDKSWIWTASGFSFIRLSAGRGYHYITENEKPKFYFKAGVLGIVAIGLVFFMMNTLSHNLTPKPMEKELKIVEIRVPKPFTIQVAAYLKQDHADRYIDTLKNKEIDARLKKVDGGGKTWYVVRVSEFIDKKSATEYGKKLKNEGTIDDFFVSNNADNANNTGNAQVDPAPISTQ